MATSLADDTVPEGLMDTRSASLGRGLGRAEGLWTLFGASILVAFLSYVVLSGG